MHALAADERLEREVQASVIRFYRQFDVQVIRFSEGRRTRVTPGWPDLACFHLGKRSFWLHETKRVTGQQSPAQMQIHAWCEACGIAYVLGGVGAATRQLISLGLILP